MSEKNIWGMKYVDAAHLWNDLRVCHMLKHIERAAGKNIRGIFYAGAASWEKLKTKFTDVPLQASDRGHLLSDHSDKGIIPRCEMEHAEWRH